MFLNRQTIVRLLAIIFGLFLLMLLIGCSILAFSPSARGSFMIDSSANCDGYSAQPRDTEDYLWWLPGTTGKGFETISEDPFSSTWSELGKSSAKVSFLIRIRWFVGGMTIPFNTAATVNVTKQCP